MSRFPFFNRSNTIHMTHSESSQKPCNIDRSGSLRKFYNSVDSMKSAGSSMRGRMVKKLSNLFETTKDSSKSAKLAPSEELRFSRTKSNLSHSSNLKLSDSSCSLFRLPEATEDRIVVYFTSLRGIRRTFEDCNAVLMILKGFRVWVDERDVSMDIAYRQELQSMMGEKKVSLPQVFIRGKYIGGADVIKNLFECGELGKLLEGFPKKKPGFVCGSCGDARFAPCWDCNGSRKVFDEDEGVIKRCLECNENGLIRCPNCNCCS